MGLTYRACFLNLSNFSVNAEFMGLLGRFEAPKGAVSGSLETGERREKENV
jgi:hypothetical protein